MLNIQEMLIQAMKNQIFTDEAEKNLNTVARQILGEMKTKIKDIKGDITTEMQYKMLQKMKKDRENSVKIYSDAYEKTHSDVAKTNLEKAELEIKPIDYFLSKLEDEMPKKLNADETREFIRQVIEKFETKPNKGMVMKQLKENPNIDMSIAAKLVNEFGI